MRLMFSIAVGWKLKQSVFQIIMLQQNRNHFSVDSEDYCNTMLLLRNNRLNLWLEKKRVRETGRVSKIVRICFLLQVRKKLFFNVLVWFAAFFSSRIPVKAFVFVQKKKNKNKWQNHVSCYISVSSIPSSCATKMVRSRISRFLLRW